MVAPGSQADGGEVGVAVAAVKGGAERLIVRAAAILFPPVCPGCRVLVHAPGTLCAQCWPKVRFLERPWCEVLGTPFAHEMGEGAVSPAAITNPPPFARARSAVAYKGAARQIVQNLKYRDRTDLAPWMAAWMLRAGAELVRDADLVVPVPLHRRRFFTRRFNQSAELARHVARLSGLRYSATAVLRHKATRQQVGLAARAREENVRGAFAVPEAAEVEVRGRRVLVVDDVFTTGATVSAVTKALKKGGAREVDVLTFARALPGDEPGDFLPDEADTI
jgi:ComF family protein